MNKIIIYFLNGELKEYEGDKNYTDFGYTGDFLIVNTKLTKYVYQLGSIEKIDYIYNA